MSRFLRATMVLGIVLIAACSGDTIGVEFLMPPARGRSP